MVEFYAFLFCQGGFRQAGMTFEQFLLVAAAVKPADLPATRNKTRMFELIPLDAACEGRRLRIETTTHK
jgi:hypothetical protein